MLSRRSDSDRFLARIVAISRDVALADYTMEWNKANSHERAALPDLKHWAVLPHRYFVTPNSAGNP